MRLLEQFATVLLFMVVVLLTVSIPVLMLGWVISGILQVWTMIVHFI